MRNSSSRGILDRLGAGVVQGAEGYVFELERRGYIKAGPYVPEVVLDFPDAVRELHREFLRAGSDVMVALTYYAHREKLRILAAEGAQVVGLNCDRGPQTMMPLMARIRETVDCAVAAQPVPYRTDPAAPTMQALRSEDRHRAFPLALEPFGCTRFEMAQFALQARDLGVDYVGICCGAGPHHVR